jgi:hypothetical protein
MRGLSLSNLTIVLAATLLAMAIWRWHSAAVIDPDRVASGGQPAAVLLIQEWDCPDRRAAMAGWLERLRTNVEAEELPVSLAVLDQRTGDLDPILSSLPRMGREDVSRVARAVQRTGIPGTPALILLDGEGRVLLTDTFGTSGAGPRLALAATLLPRILPPSVSTGPRQLEGR